jgi:DNA-binding transcriptional regulator/RsmH inhibitor MraZ
MAFCDGAGGEIVLAGRGKTLECWDPGNFRTLLERETAIPDG